MTHCRHAIIALAVILSAAHRGSCVDVDAPDDGARDSGVPLVRGDPFADYDPGIPGPQPVSLDCRAYFALAAAGALTGELEIDGVATQYEIVSAHSGLRSEPIVGTSRVSCWHHGTPSGALADAHPACRPTTSTGESWAAAEYVPRLVEPGTTNTIVSGLGVCWTNTIAGRLFVYLSCWPVAVGGETEVYAAVGGHLVWWFVGVGEVARARVCPRWNRYLLDPIRQ